MGLSEPCFFRGKGKIEILADQKGREIFICSEIDDQRLNENLKVELTNKIKNQMLKDLEEFTKLYFKRNPPDIKWKKMEARGIADRRNNIIYLDPINIYEEKFPEIEVGIWVSYRPKTRLKFSECERFFKTLLHEIGHFKIRLKPPREYYSYRKKLQKMYPNNIKIQIDLAYDVIEMKKNESPENYQGRLADFRYWLAKGWTVEEHIEVEDWALKEFKKQRKKIKQIIKRWK